MQNSHAPSACMTSVCRTSSKCIGTSYICMFIALLLPSQHVPSEQAMWVFTTLQAGNPSLQFNVTNTIDEILQILTVKVEVRAADVSNMSRVSKVDPGMVLVAGGSVGIRIFAQDRYGNVVKEVPASQAPVLDVFFNDTVKRTVLMSDTVKVAFTSLSTDEQEGNVQPPCKLFDK